MSEKTFDAIVVGAGFAGIYMLHRLKQQGLNSRVYEAGTGVGGTWFWNRYPGARCDIPSMEYSYQFSDELQQEWEWTEKYATQPEILKYAEHVVGRFDLGEDIQFETRVSSAVFDEAKGCWQLQLDTDETVLTKYVVMATGCLSVPNFPRISGIDDFTGPIYHTGLWPHEGVDFKGKKVAVIGTGSSAIQSLPIIAAEASTLTIFQRTANYSIPARNEPLEPGYVDEIKARYRSYRGENWERGFGADFRDNDQSALEVGDEDRRAEYEDRWARGGLPFLAAYNDLVFDDQANGTARDFFREKIAEKIEDRELAKKLIPDFPIGCKRLCVDTDYYEIYNQDHVQLVDINEQPIEEVTKNGIRTSTMNYEADIIVLATGFDAMTGAVTRIDIRGRDNRTLEQKWAEGPRAFLGLATEGFPNMFLVTGPGSPSVLSNMLPSIEQHVEWISDCIEYLTENQYKTIDVDAIAEDAWVSHVNEVGDTSVYPRCNSWYLGSNVEGKKRVFMPYLGVPPYVEKCRQVVDDGYDGFVLSA